jgi:hypothetical protein
VSEPGGLAFWHFASWAATSFGVVVKQIEYTPDVKVGDYVLVFSRTRKV